MKPDNIRTCLFSKAIKDRLTSLDMDIATFTRRLAMKRVSTVEQWIAGTALPGDGHLVRIAQVLDMDPADVFLLWAGYFPDQDIAEPEVPLPGGLSTGDPF